MNKVRIFDLQYDDLFQAEFLEGCKEILKEAYLSNHTFVRRFESEFANFNGSRFAHMVSNGTSAIETALRSLDVRGKKILLPSNTFIATAVAVRNAGATPVLLDVEPHYFSIDPEQVASRITDPDVGAVVVVHIGSHISPTVTEVQKTCQQAGVPLVEDSAQGLFAKLDGISAGNFGTFGCFSLYLTKVMSTGEGGMLVTNEPKMSDIAYSVRQFGMDPENRLYHIREGSNFKATEFQGLLGSLELKRVGDRIGRRRAISQRYAENLQGSSWRLILDNERTWGSYYKQMMIAPVPRAEVEKKFKEKEIPLTGGVYYVPLHRQPIFSNQEYRDKMFPISSEFADHHICPPCFPEVEDDQVDYICETLLEIAK